MVTLGYFTSSGIQFGRDGGIRYAKYMRSVGVNRLRSA